MTTDTEDTRDDGDGRQGNWEEMVTEKHGGRDVGQQGQWK